MSGSLRANRSFHAGFAGMMAYGLRACRARATMSLGAA